MNKKRLQVILSQEAWATVEKLTNEANSGFETGSISFSDVIDEMVLNSKVDIKSLQLKHTDIKRSLRVWASKDNVDVDFVLKSLMELKAKSANRKSSKSPINEGDQHE